MRLWGLVSIVLGLVLLSPTGCGPAANEGEFPDGCDPGLADFSDEYGGPLLDPTMSRRRRERACTRVRKRAVRVAGGKIEAELISGSMPRR